MKNLFRNIVPCLTLASLFVSCKKSGPAPPVFSEAYYQISITGKWQGPDFGVPPGVHFTTVTGAVHHDGVALWRPGSLASPGLESLAETGSTSLLLREIDTLVYQQGAIGPFLVPAPPATGQVQGNIYCNSHFSRVSFASMIAPSPDWFIGLSSINLYIDNQWIEDTTLQLFVHDAGSEDGDVFGYNNPATDPRQPIVRLQAAQATVLANGQDSLRPIAEVRFRLQ